MPRSYGPRNGRADRGAAGQRRKHVREAAAVFHVAGSAVVDVQRLAARQGVSVQSLGGGHGLVCRLRAALQVDGDGLKIRVGDMEDFNRIHGEQLIALPGVRQTRTFFVMKEVVDNAPLDF